MINKPLISVLIPAYNVEEYIEEAIFSILNQSYENIEIIVVDDCSKDKTYEILLNIKKHDSRVKVFRNSENMKIAQTLNFGLKHCQGDYILRMDGDDISEKNRIQELLSFLINNEKFDLVGSGFNSINEKGEFLTKFKYPDKSWKINLCLKYGPPVLHIWLARSEVYRALNGYRDIPGAEDYDFLLRMKSNGFNFVNLNSILYNVRLRTGNSLSTIGYKQRILSLYVYNLYLERLNNGEDSFDGNLCFYNLGYNEEDNNKFNQSLKSLNKAIILKSEKKYLKMFFNLFLSITISKVQYKYVFNRFIFKIINFL